ncbi:MAG: hypothetical protein QOE90_3524 [Thermoplasmata archaeon]|nr:hypothetical protein [Thermoplasmata archaeon]
MAEDFQGRGRLTGEGGGVLHGGVGVGKAVLDFARQGDGFARQDADGVGVRSPGLSGYPRLRARHDAEGKTSGLKACLGASGRLPGDRITPKLPRCRGG